MARYTKKRKYNKYNNYNWNTFKKSNSVVSRAWKSIKEANKNNTQIDFAFKINYAFNVFFEKEDATSTNPKGYGVAALNVYKVLLKSENFKNMMKNYDQVKINGVTCRLNVCDAEISLSERNVGAINVVTGWDKTGLSVVRSFGNESVGDVEFFHSAPDAMGTVKPISPEYFDQKDIPAYTDTSTDPPTEVPAEPNGGCPVYFRNVIGARLAEGYGAKKGLLNSYQRFSRYESCFPSTMDEKTAYVPTANFNDVETSIDTTGTGAIQISGEYSDSTVNDLLSIPNPCLPFEQLGFNWKPTLLVGCFRTSINGGTVQQYGECNNVVFNAEFTIPVTFKGQKGDR